MKPLPSSSHSHWPRHRRVLAGATALTLLASALWAIGQPAPPAIPAVALPQEPLHTALAVDKPTMTLALSVEYPTVGAQYVTASATDNSYSSTNEYLGYYDAEGCYQYNDKPTESRASDQSLADYKRFDRSGPARQRQCSDAFSGNFLNWASSSAIDMLRLALSGGDRYIDTPTLTVLQRAVIPDGDPVCMWNSRNFPAKQLRPNGGGDGAYWGAVPKAMVSEANGGDIWVANTLNRIYFGTRRGGNCNDPGSYTLGTDASAIGPIRDRNGALPASTTRCAGENGNCATDGVQEVWYGAGNRWKVAPVKNFVSCRNNIFGDPAPGTAKACYTRAYTGSWKPPTSAGLNSDGFFYARVQVCNRSGETLQDKRDYGLCRQYPNGNYKPTGVIQKYGDQMRLAAFGYLMDQTSSRNNGRYGGVLRAPMKYVGHKTFDSDGRDNTPALGNGQAEWSAHTGVFTANPNGAAEGISGVINYLNQFGRTGPVPGRYKRFDPVGEMYYQSLRYLQGLPPTTEAVQNINTAMRDGFPVYTDWQDPYGGDRSDSADYTCQKNNIVVIGDVNTHDGNWRTIPDTDKKSANTPNFRTWHSLVQSFEKNQATAYVDGQGVARVAGNPNGANNDVPAGTANSQLMAYAYWAHTQDIRGSDWTLGAGTKRRPGLRVRTYVFDVNENGTESNDNKRRFRNQFFMAAKYGGFEDNPANIEAKPYNRFGNPFLHQDGSANNDVWQKSNAAGEAGTYYLQSAARDVLNAFDEIFNRASTSARSIAGGSVASRQLSSSHGSVSYSASFDTTYWTGDVVAEPIVVGANRQISIAQPLWSAAAKLNAMANAPNARRIFVGAGQASATPAANAFTWSEIGPQLQAHLSRATPQSPPDQFGERRLQFLRGDRSFEGQNMRQRSGLLGDIVNSNVVYSGPPSAAYASASYAAFRTSAVQRTPAVFAGANDGMVHAFNARTGDELFAYIPSWFGPRLSAIASPSFLNQHQNYADGPLAVKDAQVAFSGQASDWKTVLVGGTGAGGAGVFALDVTDPATFAKAQALWEFTPADDADIGQVIGHPQILKFRTGTAADGQASYRWFAVVGSGVNNYVAQTPGGPRSSSGDAALFLLALDKPVGTAWQHGSNYFKVSLPTQSALAAQHATGLVNFTALYGAQGEVTHVYAGDLHGKLWKLQFEGRNPSQWNAGQLSPFVKGTAGNLQPYPLYIARDSSTTPQIQPITAAPTLFAGPVVRGVNSFYVTFGTGKYLETSDRSDQSPNSFYVLYDDGSASADSSPAGASAISGRSRLAQAEINAQDQSLSVPAFQWGRPRSATDTSKRAGWYLDLPAAGEKSVSGITDLGGLNAAFNTLVPGSASSQVCSHSQGSGRSYALHITNGSGQYLESQVGMLGPAIFISNEQETQLSASDSTGRRVRTTTQRGVSLGQSGLSTSGQAVQVEQVVGRLSWRQIHRYQDMKSATP